MVHDFDASVSATATPFLQQAQASASEVEATVLSICRRLLRASDFGVTDNFFDAGGHSLMAMTLSLEIEKELGVTIGLETIFRTPTVRELCASLHESKERKAAAILPMTQVSSQRTLYFVHYALSELNSVLPGDIATAFVTINDAKFLRELIGRKDRLGAIDRIADAYAEAISARHRTGSFCLAGSSFAGILAVETACKLERRGIIPDAVFLFDPYLHRYVYRVLYDIVHDGWLPRKIAMLRKDWRKHATRVSRKAFNPPSGNHNVDLESELSSLRAQLLVASEAYRGPSCALRSQTVLFRATRSPGGKTMQPGGNLGWARRVGTNLTVIPAPGDHFDLVTGEQARFIAAEINRRMPQIEPMRHRNV
jgi:acetoacetyl-CoA synthetase